VQVNYANLQVFVSAMQMLIKQTSKQIDAGLESRLRTCTQALSKSFVDLDHVLSNPSLEYRVLTDFFVNAMSKTLKNRLENAKVIVHEVCNGFHAPLTPRLRQTESCHELTHLLVIACCPKLLLCCFIAFSSCIALPMVNFLACFTLFLISILP
jgi:hypothetical protein